MDLNPAVDYHLENFQITSLTLEQVNQNLWSREGGTQALVGFKGAPGVANVQLLLRIIDLKQLKPRMRLPRGSTRGEPGHCRTTPLKLRTGLQERRLRNSTQRSEKQARRGILGVMEERVLATICM